MKLIAIVEKVNQKYNKNLIGDIVIVETGLCLSGNELLCYKELEHDRYTTDYELMQMCFKLMHEVSNVTIIGVL